MFGLMTVKKHEERMEQLRDLHRKRHENLLASNLRLHGEIATMKAKRTKSNANLIAANAKRKADALAKKASA